LLIAPPLTAEFALKVEFVTLTVAVAAEKLAIAPPNPLEDVFALKVERSMLTLASLREPAF
jgi:hypothetical protein